MKTDTELQQDVVAELNWEAAVPATQIGVEVRNGVVTLAGQLDSYAQMWHAERAVQRVGDVKELVTELTVRLSGPIRHQDADIARSIENILLASKSLPDGAISVAVEDGWVTLSGEVAWQYQRQAAIDGVRHPLGVRGVSDRICIKPPVSAGAVDMQAVSR
jgi:osmotically-inducible protein OsmY